MIGGWQKDLLDLEERKKGESELESKCKEDRFRKPGGKKFYREATEFKFNTRFLHLSKIQNIFTEDLTFYQLKIRITSM